MFSPLQRLSIAGLQLAACVAIAPQSAEGFEPYCTLDGCWEFAEWNCFENDPCTQIGRVCVAIDDAYCINEEMPSGCVFDPICRLPST